MLGFLKKLKNQLLNINILKRAGSLVGLSILIFFVVALISHCFDVAHTNFLNSKGNKVVRILVGNGGGTGFHVKAPSGKTYILTNGHVCGFRQSGEATVQTRDGRRFVRQIVKLSDKTDLCLIEGVPEETGLSLASSYDFTTEPVYAVGHPQLMDIVISKGNIVQRMFINVMVDMITTPEAEAKCLQNKIMHIETYLIFGVLPVQICVMSVHANQTTVVILPGNSGSPMLNTWGNVVGVFFAGGGDASWGAAIPLADVKDLLKDF